MLETFRRIKLIWYCARFRCSRDMISETAARARVLDLLDTADARDAEGVSQALPTLGLQLFDMARARARVLDLLDTADADDARTLAGLLAELGPEPTDMARARARVLDLLETARSWEAGQLVEALIWLGPEPSDKARARSRVLDLLNAPGEFPRPFTHGISPHEGLLESLGELDPRPSDLAGSASWEVSPTPILLAAVRRNYSLEQWLDALPGIVSVPRRGFSDHAI